MMDFTQDPAKPQHEYSGLPPLAIGVCDTEQYVNLSVNFLSQHQHIGGETSRTVHGSPYCHGKQLQVLVPTRLSTSKIGMHHGEQDAIVSLHLSVGPGLVGSRPSLRDIK